VHKLAGQDKENNNINLFIVHCIDTEGPMYEPLNDTFKRLNAVFNINIYPSKKNLHRLQNMEINLNGIEKDVMNFVLPQRINMNETWDQIDDMLENIMSDGYRNKFKDSNGKGWVYSWFCLDHVGFMGNNPRRRDAGHHNVFDKYMAVTDNGNDIVQWHYHPLPANGHYNCSGMAYLNSPNIWEILSRKIIDRQWFPSVYRPGFHTERPDSHWFLEQWIPFDFANQSIDNDSVSDLLDNGQVDLSSGRYGYWKNAITEWRSYNPSYENYQLEGSCKRSIFRCLNMESRIRELTLGDVKKAFQRASEGKDTILSFTNHDFRDMVPEIDKVRNYIEIASKKYPSVNFSYENALSAARKHLNLKGCSPSLKLKVKHLPGRCYLEIQSLAPIFGVQPFFCIKTYDGRYIWENLDFISLGLWSFTMDWNHIEPNMVQTIGIAVNSKSGSTKVINYSMESRKTTYYDVNN